METKILHGIPLFESLRESETQIIASLIEVSRWSKDSVVVKEGEESSCLYIILTGKVKVFLIDESGEEIILNYLHEGDYFGEVSLFDDGQRSASVITLADSYLGKLEKDVFMELMSSYPDLGMSIIKGTTRRVRELSNNVRSLAANW